MVNILPIASGKGGVGKSAVAVNLSILLARRQKKVVLIDFDLGGANLHTLLGLKNNHAGLGNFIYSQETSIEPLLQQTGIPNLAFIAGDCLFPGTPNMTASVKRRLIKQIMALDADYAVLDLGGGTTYNTLDIYLLTYNSILVTSPELTSILNAYSFLKSAAYRFLARQFKSKSEERLFIDEYIRNSAAGGENSLAVLLDGLAKKFPESSQKARNELAKYRPQAILNMGKSTQDLEMARRLKALSQSKLTVPLDFVGFLPRDEGIELAVATRRPISITNPQSAFVRQLDAAAERILLHSYEYNSALEENEEPVNENSLDDLKMLGEEFTGVENNLNDSV